MKHKKILICALCVLAIVLVSAISLHIWMTPDHALRRSIASTSEERISRPFEYSGYTKPEYSSYTKRSEYVTMPDGVKLAVDIYLPAGERTEQPSFPVVFQYTPYGRAFIIRESSLLKRVGMRYAIGTAEPMVDRANSHDTVYGSSDTVIQTLLSCGYAYVCADMRGTGASYGTKVDFMPQIADDGKALIDWMASQDWCDGNVGMFGGSYLGYTQLVTAAKQPEALKCIIPEVTAFDGYTGEIRPGGIFLWAYSQQDMQIFLEHNCDLPEEYCYPTAPVIDEDGDGDYADEIPLDLNGNGSFLDDYSYPEDPDDEPRYADGKKREHIYYLATREHLQNVPYNDLGGQAKCLDTELTFGELTVSAYDVSPVANLDKIMESGIAVFNHGGWMDAFTRGTTELYCTLEATNPSRMVIDPGYHMGTSPFWSYCGENEAESVKAYALEYLRFYDHYLKGVDNGIDTEAPVYIYNMNGDGWREENEWPLARQTELDYYLGADLSMGPDRSGTGADLYTVDFSHISDWGTDYAQNRQVMETPDELPYRTEYDKKCLCYTSAPLSADMEITGYPMVDIFVSSTADTGDFYFYLEDVDASGNALLVTEGELNASFAQLWDNDTVILSGSKNIDVLPELPWHGYEESQENSEVFSNGTVVELLVDLMPTSWVFKSGHSIRLSIACANNTIFELTPSLAPENKADDIQNIIPEITIYRDEEHPSRIILPVIPR